MSSRPALGGVGLLVALVCLIAVLVGDQDATSAPLGVGMVARALANSQTFVDPTGDNGNGSAPDITTIRVSNDDTGNLELRIVFANRAEVLRDDWISVVLDTDSSGATGCGLGGTFGADWSIDLRGTIAEAVLLRLDSSCDSQVQDVLPTGFEAASGTLLVRLRTQDIGGPKSFRFAIIATFGLPQDDGSTSDVSADEFFEITVAPPKPPRDRTPPRVKSLSTTGAPGRVAQLRYSVFEETGRAREEISIYRGTSLLEVKHTPLGRRSVTKVYVKRWRIPKSTTRSLRYCVQAWDASGNRSAPNCARIVVR